MNKRTRLRIAASELPELTLSKPGLWPLWDSTGIDLEWLPLYDSSYFNSFGTVVEPLLSGQVDLLAIPLKKVPLSLPEGTVLASLSERLETSLQLWVRKGKENRHKILHLPEAAHVVTSQPLFKGQLAFYRPDLNIQVEVRLDQGKSGIETFPDADALMGIFPLLDSHFLNPEDWQVTHLNWREFVTMPGEGVTALVVCTDDLFTRRLAQQMHHRLVAAETNVERSLAVYAEEAAIRQLGVRCQLDANGHYHLAATIQKADNEAWKSVTLSSSTSYQLAEQAWEMLCREA